MIFDNPAGNIFAHKLKQCNGNELIKLLTLQKYFVVAVLHQVQSPFYPVGLCQKKFPNT